MNWLISSVEVDFISDFNIRNTKNASYYFISDSDKSTMKTPAQNHTQCTTPPPKKNHNNETVD